MEDTWKTGDLEKHMRRGGYNEDNMRRKDRRRTEEEGIKERSGDSERQHRDREREAPRERDRPRERDSTREKTKPRDPDRDKDQDRRREGTRDRAAEKDERDRERRRERERAGEMDRPRDSSRTGDRDHESRERRNDRAEKDSRDKERERRRAERDRERGTERERKREEGRDGDRERDRDRTRERERDRDREHDDERRREKERHRDSSKHVKEMNHHKDDLQEKHFESKREDERRERHSEREHSRRKEGKEYQEQRRTDKEDRERRHREREEHHSREGRRHDDKPRDEERERSRRVEARHRLPSDRDRRSHDQPGKRRPAEEGDGENGLVEVTPEAHLDSGRDNEKKEPKDAKARAGIGRNTSAAFSQVEKVEVEIERTSAEDQGDEDGAENYEEDFEDYEDDFEDESDREEDDDGEKSEEGNKEAELSPQKRKEIEEIRRAMNAENERVGSSQQRHAVEESEIRKGNSDVPESKSNQHGKFIDFVAAKHREASKKIASKQKKRSTELLRLIDLDFSINIPLLDLPPVNEYDMYIKSFGTTNTKQAYVQCNEDDADRDVQTEEIEADDKWTQHPGDGGTVCGGPKLISEASDQSVAKMNIDSKRLAEFLLSASQVVAVLLEEDRAEMHSLRKLKSQADSLSCSDVCVQLNTKLPFLHGREVSLISFSQVQRQTLLSVHSPTTKPSAVRLDSKTVLCIWNIWEPSCPQKVLVYESEVLCCCFSPGKATLVFAGTSVGSVVVWDLREHSSLHHTLTIGDKDWTLRYPTFSTDAVLSGHMSSVRSVEPVPAAVVEGLRPESSLLPSHQDSPGSSFQLASLDESGVMNMWVVVELPKADQAGSQTDLGLKPGGKVKLLHSSTLITNERSSERDAVKTGPLRTLLLKFFPSDSNHFFIGTDMGLVTHGTRHGLKIPPKFYRPQEEGLRPVHITAVDVSPFGEPLFLVGCADGTIRMHSVKSEQPLMEWSRSTGAEPVLSVQWALTRPAVFCVLDAASNLHMWDLLEKDYEPVMTEKVHSDRVTAMAVFGDPAKPNTLSGVSLAKQTGEIEIQYFSKRWAVPTTAEQDTLHNIMSEVF